MLDLSFKELCLFVRNVNRSESGCWLWKASTNTNGYGKWGIPGTRKLIAAHRAAYEIFVGPIPSGLDVLHDCDTPLCVNPRHLHVGTHTMNMREAWARNRHPPQDHAGEKNPRAKLTRKEAEDIRRRYKAGGIRLIDLAVQYGIGTSTVHSIVTRQSWQ